MAKISAHGAREIGRWVKPGSGGETLVLTQRPNGKTTLLRKWTKGATFATARIVVGRKANGGPVYSERPTLEQAHEWATSAGFERVYGRR